MRALIFIAAAAALAGCSQRENDATVNTVTEADAATTADANAAVDANMAGTTPASITETSWEFTDPDTKKPVFESVDAAGKYIANSGEDHLDHGTAVMKDGKACFTSAMTKEGEVCWTDPKLAIGQSGQTTSDKGETITVKRVVYTPLTM